MFRERIQLLAHQGGPHSPHREGLRHCPASLSCLLLQLLLNEMQELLESYIFSGFSSASVSLQKTSQEQALLLYLIVAPSPCFLCQNSWHHTTQSWALHKGTHLYTWAASVISTWVFPSSTTLCHHCSWPQMIRDRSCNLPCRQGSYYCRTLMVILISAVQMDSKTLPSVTCLWYWRFLKQRNQWNRNEQSNSSTKNGNTEPDPLLQVLPSSGKG